jgi:serine/threonine protein kinase
MSSLPVVLGEFELLGRLARGRTGDVHYAIRVGADVRRDEWLALKCLASDLQMDAQLVARWLLAAERAAQVVHPGLCRVFQAGSSDGNTFCAMELCRGLDLGQIRERLHERGERIPPQLAAWLMRKVAAAIEAAHGHRAAGFTAT